MGFGIRATLGTTLSRAVSAVTGLTNNGVAQPNGHAQNSDASPQVSEGVTVAPVEKGGLYHTVAGYYSRFRSGSSQGSEKLLETFDDIAATHDRIPSKAYQDLRNGFYQQVFQPTLPDSVSEPSPELIQYVGGTLTESLSSMFLTIQELSADGFYDRLLELDPSYPCYEELKSLVIRTKHGEDTWLRRLADAFVAINLIRNENTLTANSQESPIFNIETDYLPFYYSLRGGVLVAQGMGPCGDRLLSYFSKHLNYVDYLFGLKTKQQPPKFEPQVLFGLPRSELRSLIMPKSSSGKQFTPQDIDLNNTIVNGALHRMTDPQDWTDDLVMRPPILDAEPVSDIDIDAIQDQVHKRLASINDPQGIMSQYVLRGLARMWMGAKAMAGKESDYSHAKLVTVLLSFLYEAHHMGKGLDGIDLTNEKEVLAGNDLVMQGARRIMLSSASYLYKSVESILREAEAHVQAALEGRHITKGQTHSGFGDIPKTAAEDGASRIAPRRKMAEAWPIKNIGGPLNATVIDRPGDARFNNYYDQVMAGALALYQRFQGLENREPHSKETDYTSGTRSPVGGVWTLRGGSAKMIANLFVPGFSRSDIPLRMVSSTVGLDMVVPSKFDELAKGALAKDTLVVDRTSYFDPIELYHDIIQKRFGGNHPANGQEWHELRLALAQEIKAQEYQMQISLMVEALGDLRFAKEEGKIDKRFYDMARFQYDLYIKRYADAFHLLEKGHKVPQGEVASRSHFVVQGHEGDVNLELVEWCKQNKAGYDFVVQLYNFVQTAQDDHHRWDGQGEPPRVKAPNHADRGDLDQVFDRFWQARVRHSRLKKIQDKAVSAVLTPLAKLHLRLNPGLGDVDKLDHQVPVQEAPSILTSTDEGLEMMTTESTERISNALRAEAEEQLAANPQTRENLRAYFEQLGASSKALRAQLDGVLEHYQKPDVGTKPDKDNPRGTGLVGAMYGYYDAMARFEHRWLSDWARQQDPEHWKNFTIFDDERRPQPLQADAVIPLDDIQSWAFKKNVELPTRWSLDGMETLIEILNYQALKTPILGKALPDDLLYDMGYAVEAVDTFPGAAAAISLHHLETILESTYGQTDRVQRILNDKRTLEVYKKEARRLEREISKSKNVDQTESSQASLEAVQERYKDRRRQFEERIESLINANPNLRSSLLAEIGMTHWMLRILKSDNGFNTDTWIQANLDLLEGDTEALARAGRLHELREAYEGTLKNRGDDARLVSRDKTRYENFLSLFVQDFGLRFMDVLFSDPRVLALDHSEGSAFQELYDARKAMFQAHRAVGVGHKDMMTELIPANNDFWQQGMDPVMHQLQLSSYRNIVLGRMVEDMGRVLVKRNAAFDSQEFFDAVLGMGVYAEVDEEEREDLIRQEVETVLASYEKDLGGDYESFVEALVQTQFQSSRFMALEQERVEQVIEMMAVVPDGQEERVAVMNSRKINRPREKQIRNAYEKLETVVLKAMKGAGMDISGRRPIAPLFSTNVSNYAGLSLKDRAAISQGTTQFGLHSVAGVMQLLESEFLEQGADIADKLAIRWANQVDKIINQSQLSRDSNEAELLIYWNAPVIAAIHSSWADFSYILTQIRAVNPDAYEDFLVRMPRILAKAGLEHLIPLIGPAIARLAIPVGNSRMEYLMAEDRAAYSMVFGDVPRDEDDGIAARSGPRPVGLFPELTMAFGDFLNLIAPPEFTLGIAPQSQLLPINARALHIAQRAMGMSGRHQMMLLSGFSGSFPIYPKPDGITRYTNETPSTNMMMQPLFTSWIPSKEALNMTQQQWEESIGNYTRLIWYMNSIHPDHVVPNNTMLRRLGLDDLVTAAPNGAGDSSDENEDPQDQGPYNVDFGTYRRSARVGGERYYPTANGPTRRAPSRFGVRRFAGNAYAYIGQMVDQIGH